MNAIHFRQHVIKPTLDHINMWSQPAEDLLCGTALAESKLRWLTQHGGGPALGVYQIEPATFSDIWDRYLERRTDIKERVEELAAPAPSLERQLITNLAFATAIARVRYFMDPAPLPSPHDMNYASYVFALAETWKRVFNTHQGAGTVDHFVASYQAGL